MYSCRAQERLQPALCEYPGHQSNVLEKVFLAHGFPKDAAVFGNVDMTFPGSICYLNPRASEIAAGIVSWWNGQECQDPGEPVALLVGNQDAYFKQNPSQRMR